MTAIVRSIPSPHDGGSQHFEGACLLGTTIS
jgi:hypothetical protein